MSFKHFIVLSELIQRPVKGHSAAFSHITLSTLICYMLYKLMLLPAAHFSPGNCFGWLRTGGALWWFDMFLLVQLTQDSSESDGDFRIRFSMLKLDF